MPVSVDHAEIVAELQARIGDDAVTIAALRCALSKTEAALAEAKAGRAGDSAPTDDVPQQA